MNVVQKYILNNGLNLIKPAIIELFGQCSLNDVHAISKNLSFVVLIDHYNRMPFQNHSGH